MDEKKLKEISERYVELLIAYDTLYDSNGKSFSKKVMETRKELVYLETKLRESWRKNKRCGVNKWPEQAAKIYSKNLIEDMTI